MTEFEYIRSLNDQELAEYMLNACINYTRGVLDVIGVKVVSSTEPTPEAVDYLVKGLSQPHREPQE